MNWKASQLFEKYPAFFSGLLIVIIVLVSQHVLFRVFEMPLEQSFYDGNLLITHFFQLSWKTILGLLGVFTFAIVLSIWKPAGISDTGLISRWLYIGIIVMQTYAIVFIDYNHFYGEWFFWDRLILLALGIGSLINPYILPFYLFQLMLLIGQLKFPAIIGYDLTHKSLILPVLLAFWVCFIINKLWHKRFRWHLFILIFLSIIASWYLTAGIGKIQLNWYADNNLYNMLAASVDAGWLHDLDNSWLQQLAAFIDAYHVPLQYGGLVIEVILPLLLLIDRRLTIGCLTGFISLHVLVYLLSGIFFWQWMVLEIVVIAALILKKEYAQGVFTKQNLALYAILLVLNPFFMDITKLAWLDCGYINSYTFFLVDKSGDEKRLDSSFFSPYDVGFAKNRYTFMRKENVLANTLGQCYDAQIVVLTDNWSNNNLDKNLQKVKVFKENRGMEKYDQTKSKVFKNFLRTFSENKLTYDPKFVSNIDVPLHMEQGPNQQNIVFKNASTLKILYEEKVVLADLEFYRVETDTIFLKLKTHQQ